MKAVIARYAKWARPAIGWFVVGATCFVAAGRSVDVSRALDLNPAEAAGPIMLAGLFGAMASFLVVTYKLARTLLRSGKEFVALRRSREGALGFAESGVVMVEFTLIAPTVWWIMAMAVQMAMIAQASIVVRYAAYAAARSAVVQLGRESAPWLQEDLENSAENKAEKAAKLVLCSLSPKNEGTTDNAAKAMRDIFASQNGVWGDSNFDARYDYADPATTVTIEVEQPDFEIPLIGMPLPIGDIFAPAMVRVTVEYLYLTKIPGMSLIPDGNGKIGTVAPNGGWAFPITQVVELQGAGGREGNVAIVGVQVLLGEAFP
jgi:hypothetical protein